MTFSGHYYPITSIAICESGNCRVAHGTGHPRATSRDHDLREISLTEATSGAPEATALPCAEDDAPWVSGHSGRRTGCNGTRITAVGTSARKFAWSALVQECRTRIVMSRRPVLDFLE